jgi:excisionase family DNA binding protein
VARELAALTSDAQAGRAKAPAGARPLPGAPGKRLYRVQEAAEALGLSRSTIYVQMRSRRLRSVKASRTQRIPAGATTEFVDLLRREAEDAA